MKSGKRGHLSAEYWSDPKNECGSGGSKGGKGNPMNVTGKGAGLLEQGAQTAVLELQSQPALAEFSRLVRSLHIHHEAWLRWTYDTGAAISEFPLDARIGTEKQAKYCCSKTAPGELLSDRGLCVQGTTQYGYGVLFPR